jgi:hypothetical protein
MFDYKALGVIGVVVLAIGGLYFIIDALFSLVLGGALVVGAYYMYNWYKKKK